MFFTQILIEVVDKEYLIGWAIWVDQIKISFFQKQKFEIGFLDLYIHGKL